LDTKNIKDLTETLENITKSISTKVFQINSNEQNSFNNNSGEN
jgi:hypothetical protein